MVISDKKRQQDDPHYIVAIGASAGGLEAINTFFDAADSFESVSFIIIQHLSPDYKSLLVELVSKHTKMKVYEAKNNMDIERAAIYVIPNKMTMQIENSTLRLAEKTTLNIPNNAIDIFFKSLALDKREKAIGIILSGTGSDGTKGINYIKSENGYVIVQEPSSAKFDGMPNMAIMSGNADSILPPDKMPAHIKEYLSSVNEEELDPKELLSNKQLDNIIDIILKESGNDFNYYKSPTVIRRIIRHAKQKQYTDINNYITFLSENPKEVLALSKEILINVTRFFRDPKAFEELEKTIFPEITKQKAENDIVKIWVCACSTGEEAYSLAILLDQYLQNQKRYLQVKIFATDLEEANIQIASKNSYPLIIEKDIPEALLSRYFIKEENHYAVIPRIRKQVVFAKHNVIKDPAFIKNDLISCRNMLIYMNKILQEKVLATFHFALNQNSYLFLGPSETTSLFDTGFQPINNKWKFFKKSDISNRQQHVDHYLRFTKREAIKPVDRIVEQKTVAEYLNNDFSNLMVQELGFVAIYVNSFFEVKETIGQYDQYLRLPRKKLNLNILSMLPENLSIILSEAIRKSTQEHRKIHIRNIKYKHGNHSKTVNLSVQPATSPNETLTMIVFYESGITGEEKHDLELSPRSYTENERSYIESLESQLNETRNNLQIAIERLETTNEELQSSNEELLSSNEELQSSNEELQSLNEELHTLNAEHQTKIKELIELNDDLDNYFKSTEIGQIFLSKDLKIRKFNPPAMRLINLIDSDVGRPISHFSNNFQNDHLLEGIQTVQKHASIYEKEVLLNDGKVYLMRIYPFIRKDKIRDGIVLTFVNITDLKNLHGMIKGVFDSSINAIFVLEADQMRKPNVRTVDLNIVAQNYAAENLLSLLEIEPNSSENAFRILQDKHLNKIIAKRILDTYHTDVPLKTECQLKVNNKDYWFELSAIKMRDGLVITFNDVTKQKEALHKLRKNYNELIAAREDLRELNGSLEEEVVNRTKQLALSEERFRLVAKATNDCIRDWDLVNNQIWHSDNFYDIFEYDTTANLQNIDHWFEKIHEEDRDHVKNGIFTAINQGEEQWNGEYRFRKGKDSFCYVFERSFILNDDLGIPFRIISSLMDVTTLKEAELATKELIVKKDEFMSIASHELKTPITSMKASLQLIDRMSPKEGRNNLLNNFIQKANQQVDKLIYLIETLLDVTKIQSGRIMLQKSIFNLQDVIEECIYEVQSTSSHKIQLTGDSCLNIYGDRNRIEQVLINLLTNAIKYSPKADQVDLQIAKLGQEAKITVQDYGIGIPKEKLNMVFDRFFRVDAAASQFNGLGLGLFISADIIKRHEGRIGVESVLNKGSKFWFTLPLQ